MTCITGKRCSGSGMLLAFHFHWMGQLRSTAISWTILWINITDPKWEQADKNEFKGETMPCLLLCWRRSTMLRITNTPASTGPQPQLG